jgi:hypothetical protein
VNGRDWRRLISPTGFINLPRVFEIDEEIDRIFETREAALAPLVCNRNWPNRLTGALTPTGDGLAYVTGWGRHRFTHSIHVYTVQCPEGYKVRFQLNRLPTLAVVPGLFILSWLFLVSCWQGSLSAVALFLGVFGLTLIFTCWLVIRRSEEARRAIKTIYAE